MRACIECGADVSGRGRRLYCSDECALDRRTCTTCGDEFRVPRKRKNRNNVCSLACRPLRQWGRPQTQVNCAHCGESFSAYPSKIEAGRGKYCSKECAALDRPISGRSAIADESIALFLSSFDGEHETEKRVGRWSIDLALTDLMIAVELDGEYWHGLPNMVEKDQRKDRHLSQLGWRVIRIPMRRGESPSDIARKIAEELHSCRQTT